MGELYNRQEYNKKVLKKLEEYVDKYPDMRLGQILENFFIKEDNSLFYLEPKEMLIIESKVHENILSLGCWKKE